MQALILASTSRYRRELLARLGLPFTTISPDFDETPIPGESAENLAKRLATGKAEAVAATMDASAAAAITAATVADTAKNLQQPIIIGSDQVAACGEQLLGKPGDVNTAIEQLLSMAGQAVTFHTAVHLLLPSPGGPDQHATNLTATKVTATSFTAVDKTIAVLRNLSRDEIERYVDQEPSLDCAGSFKVEGLGISLFSAVKTNDPTGLIGLPLIATCQGLRELGVTLP